MCPPLTADLFVVRGVRQGPILILWTHWLASLRRALRWPTWAHLGVRWLVVTRILSA